MLRFCEPGWMTTRPVDGLAGEDRWSGGVFSRFYSLQIFPLERSQWQSVIIKAT